MSLKDTLLLDKWYRMDNSAVIYPLSITATTQSLFRLSVTLKDYVDKELLLIALKAVLPRFPSFTVQLRTGFFRHYFDQNDHKPQVFEDNGLLFQKINFDKNKQYLFRVSFFRNKIFLDFFHALSDGSGAMELLKALVFRYLSEVGKECENDGSVKTPFDIPNEKELEDSFVTHYKKFELFGGVIGKMAGKGAHQIKGRKFRTLGYGLIEGHIPTEELVSLSKKHGVTVTAFLAASALLSVAETIKPNKQAKPLVIMIPVDLRRYFDSSTLKNFTSLIKCEVDPMTTPKTLEAYIEKIKEQLSAGLNKEELLEKLSLSSFFGVKWFMKIMPLFLKSAIIRISKRLSFGTKQTIIMSNLGIVKTPEEMKKYVNNFSFNVNISKKMPISLGVVSYNGLTSISFTRLLISTEIEKRFFTRLTKEDVNVSVISNLREIKKVSFE